MGKAHHLARRWAVRGLCFLLALCAARAKADPQVGDSGDYSNLERTIDNELVDQAPFYVGDEGDNNLLQVIHGGDLRTWGYLYIGNDIGADHNAMLVAGQNSSATNRYVTIGDSGSHNTLRIEDNAFFYTERIVRIGARSNASHNAVIVDNAEWQNARVVVGQGSQQGAYHSLLVITNGGVVKTINANYGGGYALVGWSHGRQAAVSNRAVVTGSGSTWVMTNYFSIGEREGADYNSVLVDDGGRIEAGNYMTVGNSGKHNHLEINALGEVEVAGEVRIGSSSESDSNTLHVRNGTLDVGDVLLVGREGSYNTLQLTEGGRVAVVSNVQVGAQSAGSHNELFVDGTGTHLSSEAGLQVGVDSDHNRMQLTGGATYSNLYPNVGTYGVTVWDQVGHGGDHNELIVQGTGTHWHAGNRFYIGFGGGQNNRVLLGEGARMDIASHFQIYGNNEMTVSSRAVLNLGDFVYMHGGDGAGSVLRADSGGVLTNSGARAFRIRDNSQWLLEGSETRGYWNNEIRIGEGEGHTNSLLAVRGGAELSVGDALSVGYAGETSGHRVEVEGSGSRLEASGALHVSAGGGEGNRLEIRDGGEVASGGTIVRAGGVLLLDSGILRSDLTLDNGILAPLAVTAAGGVNIVDGDLSVDHGGTLSVTLHDSGAVPLRVDGNVMLNSHGSAIELSLKEGFDGQAGDVYTVLDYSGPGGGRLGRFANLADNEIFSLSEGGHSHYFLFSYNFNDEDRIAATVLPGPLEGDLPAGPLVIEEGSQLTLGPVTLTDPMGELTYQWYYREPLGVEDPVAIEGATGDTLLLTDLSRADAGYYFIRIWDSGLPMPVQSGMVRLVNESCLDWPMWGYDATRRGLTPERLPEDLHLHWVRHLPGPRRAWGHQFDDWGKLEFDVSYAPVVMGERMFIGSMTTDSLSAYCTDSGEELWRTYLDGPVRLSPVAWEGRVYAASDDGRLYCLDAESGEKEWSFRAVPDRRRALGNERLIGMWPARGGPVLLDGTLYFAAGIWPFMGISLYALDAGSGAVIWENSGDGAIYTAQPHGGAMSFAGLAPQGYLAAFGDRLVVPGGRANPALYERLTGELVHLNLQSPGKPTGASGLTPAGGGYHIEIFPPHFYVHGRRYELSGGSSTDGRAPEAPIREIADRYQDRVDGEVYTQLAAHGRLYIVTTQGAVYAFGPEARTPVEHPLPAEDPASEAAAARAGAILGEAGVDAGYALVLGVGDGDLIEQLAMQSSLHVVGLDDTGADLSGLRRRFDDTGFYGKRIHLLSVEAGRLDIPPYLWSLIVLDDPDLFGAGWGDGLEDALFELLRPYGGVAVLGDSTLVREGPLPGTDQWTHQYANPANNPVSWDERVKPPLGPLWWGGPTNERLLPRHSMGPRPHVAGGRVIALGVDYVNARCAYTGRELWVREFPGIGHPFTNLSLESRWDEGDSVYMTNIPGASFIGSPIVSLSDSIYLRYDGAVHRLDPQTGTTLDVFALPGVPGNWGHISVQGDRIIATVAPQTFDDSEEAPGDGRGIGWRNWDYSSSEQLVVLNRFTGEESWSRPADIGYRHNAIVSSGERLFVIDGVSEEARAVLARRGLEPDEPSRILGLDLFSGDVLWDKNSSVFGTFLSYSEEHDILIEGGSRDGRWRMPDEPEERMVAHRGRDGALLWERDGSDFDLPAALHGDLILRGRDGETRCLLNGVDKQRPHPLTGSAHTHRYRRDYGCGMANYSTHMILFRSGSAGFYDLATDGGSGTFGGVRSGCTANMIAADGLLNIPDYTRTCTCNYHNQTSLALIPMPDMEYWTSSALDAGSGPVRQVGVNLGAPGMRRDGNRTLWINHPQAGVPGPEAPVSITGSPLRWFRRHAARMGGAQGTPWIAASGVEGLSQVVLENVSGADLTVELHFCEPEETVGAGERVFDVLVQGTLVESGFDVFREAGGANRAVAREYTGFSADGTFSVQLVPAAGSLPAVLSGVAVRSPSHQVEFILTHPAWRTGGGDLHQTVFEGQGAMAPLVDVPFGWDFSGWNASFANVMDALEIQALVNEIVAARGTPHAWLVEMGLAEKGDPDAQFDLAELIDLHSKGYPAYGDYIAGTDPRVPDSVFAFQPMPPDSPPLLRWQGVAGRAYDVHRATCLSAQDWSAHPIATLVAAQDGPLGFSDPDGHQFEYAFYSVVVRMATE